MKENEESVFFAGLRFRFLILWTFLLFLSIFFWNIFLDFPFQYPVFLVITGNFLLLLIWFFLPAYESAAVLFLVLAFSISATNGFLFSEGIFRIAGGVILAIASFQLGFWIKKYLYDSVSQIRNAVLQISSGNYSVLSAVNTEDERGRVLKALNRLALWFREREMMNRYVGADLWRERGQKDSQHLDSAQEKWVLSLSFVFSSQDVQKISVLESFSFLVETGRKYGAFFNCVTAGFVHLIFFAEKDGYEKNAMLCLLDFLNDVPCSETGVAVSLRWCSVRGGMSFQPQGFRYRVFSQDLIEEVQFLRSLEQEGVSCWIHESFLEKANQLFHMEGKQDAWHRIFKEKDIAFHLDNLRSKIVEEKLVSIRVLSAYRHFEAVDELIFLLQDVSPRVRIAASKALGTLITQDNELKIGQSFLEGLKKEWNHEIRATYVISLGNLKRKDLIQPLFALLRDENDRVRANAVEAIGKCMQRGTVLRHLEEALCDKNNRARANAALATWLMGSKLGLEHMIHMAKSEDPLLSCSGLYCIGEVFTDENIQIVQGFISEPSEFFMQNKELFFSCQKICEDKLFQSHPLVEKNALLALKKIRSVRSLPVLKQKYQIANQPYIRQLVLEVLTAMEEYSLAQSLKRGEYEKMA